MLAVLKKYILSHKKSTLFIVDIIAFVFACCVSYFLVNSTNEGLLEAADAYMSIAIFSLTNGFFLAIFGVYRKIWKYATILDFVSCIFGVSFGSLFATIICMSFQMQIPIAYYIETYLACMIMTTGIRIIYHMARDMMRMHLSIAEKHRMMIVGGGEAGRHIIHEMLYTSCSYYPICIVDDDPQKLFCNINGITIQGAIADIPALCKKMNIHTILIAIPSCSEKERRNIMTICSETGCFIKVLPCLHDMLDKGTSLLGQAKNINIEDLLGREQIRFDANEISEFVRGKVCMVTGGGGSIGSELCRQIMRHSPKLLIIVDIYENNAYAIQQELIRQYGTNLNMVVEIASVRDFKKMNKLFQYFKPKIVFHAAAHKHVPLMENAPEEAVKNNILGTFNIASLADWYRCEKFVLISTDKAVNPTNVMGATKRCCEMVVQYMAQQSDETEYVSVRFGNVLGSNGSVIPLFKKQIEDGGPVTVTHPDIIRYFMTIPEAVSLVLQAGAMAKGSEIFVLDMGKPVKIVTLAEKLIRLYGYEPGVDMKIEFTGLRPGEKLFEELLMDDEMLTPTENQQIFIGTQIHLDANMFIQDMAALKSCAEANDQAQVLQQLKKMVPTFHHKVDNEIEISTSITA